MLPWLFLAAAFALVAFGGLMAAVDSAIGVVSRADIVDLSIEARAARSLRAIADDPGAHVNAVNFMRILAETTAAVLVTLAFTFFIDEVWLVLLVSALVMTAVSFVLVGASPRSVGRAHPDVVLRLSAPLSFVGAFAARGFSPTARRPEFFLPMALHRALEAVPLSRAMEAAARGVGLVRALGSPVILRAEPRG